MPAFLSLPAGVVEGADGRRRCWWPGTDPLYLNYHDTEWGRPVSNDNRLFEKLCLEGFQSGLSWLTILRKRENFRAAFAGIRFREGGKVRPTRDRSAAWPMPASCATAGRSNRSSTTPGGRASWSTRQARSPPSSGAMSLIRNRGRSGSRSGGIVPTSPESIALSKELRKRGWSFVGPTTVYAFMQAMGLVNDHLHGCACREEAEAERRAFVRPK